MKQTILLMVLALGMCSINVSAQTKKPVHKVTTQTKPKVKPTPKNSREYQVGKDGFEWYKVCKNGKYGAEDRNGNIIVPAEYDGIIYDVGCFTCEGYSPVVAGFDVRKGNYRGWYNKSGRCIIPYSRGYKYIRKYDSESYGTYYTFTNDGGGGICDRNGREMVSVKIKNLLHIEVSQTFEGKKRYYLLFFDVNNLCGIADANGKIVVYPEFEYNGHQKELEQLISTRVTTTNNPLSGNTREYSAESRQSASSSSSPSLNNSSSNNNSENKTTTVVVEHHRDPVPVQEWQQCPACYGSGQCPYVKCGGSGWYYIGDRASTCSMCHGSGKCSTCAGKGGHYITVYR